MATLALGGLVLVAQNKFRVLVVVEALILPGRLVMAGLAFLPQSFFVHVILFMTVVTTLRQLLFVQLPGMAAGTACILVPAKQFERSISAVVKGRSIPFCFPVAGLTTRSEFTLVRIVATMTAQAIPGGFCIPLANMAFCARHVFMRVPQLEFCF